MTERITVPPLILQGPFKVCVVGGVLPHTALTEEPEPILEFFGVNQRGRVGPRAGRGSQGDSGCPSGHRRNTEEGDPTSCRLIKGREVELSTSVHRSGEGHPT